MVMHDAGGDQIFRFGEARHCFMSGSDNSERKGGSKEPGIEKRPSQRRFCIVEGPWRWLVVIQKLSGMQLTVEREAFLEFLTMD
jgi:hypothetical protein